MARLTSLLVTALLATTASLVARAEPPKRFNVDASDLARMSLAHPAAREALEKGETLLAGGEAAQAAILFQQASLAAPESALAARRHCQALTELGERDGAVAACRAAVSLEGSPLDLRAMVGALMAGQREPTLDELVQAGFLVGGIRRSMPNQPFAYGAELDIGWRLGDTRMLDGALENLRRIAPDHEETRRASAMIALLRPSAWVLFGWAAIAFAALATLVHALWRRLVRHRA